MNRTVAETRARVEKSLRRRYWAERRFRFYGLAAVVIGILFVVFMFGSIISKGWPTFMQASLTLEITYDAAVLDPEGRRDPDVLASADYTGLIRTALRARFPDVEGRAAGRQLMGLPSGAAY